MPNTAPLTLRPLAPGDQAACKALVLAGLQEHWGTLDPSLNPDLNDIAASFAAGLFLTAWLGDRLAGTGGYLPTGADAIQISRMSVDRSLRCQGIGRQILAELLQHARSAGYRRAILETTATWQDVITFYQRNGFTITHYQDGDVYFTRSILE